MLDKGFLAACDQFWNEDSSPASLWQCMVGKLTATVGKKIAIAV